MGGKLRSLQVLRFLAAAGVVQAHAALNFSGNANQIGACGVDVFFVLSGFIITRTARSTPDRFLLNRATRVLPPYYAFVLPWLFIGILSGHLDVRRAIASLTLWPAFDVYSPPYLIVGWTLCFEALFYVAMWLVIRGVRVSFLLTAYAAAVVVAAITGLVVFEYLGAPLIMEFLFGVALALSPIRSRGLGAGAALIAATAFTWFAKNGTLGIENHFIGEAGSWSRPLLWGAPAALLVFATMQFENLVRSRWADGLVFLGDASYSIYLSHLLTLAAIADLSLRMSPWLAGAACIGVGAVAYVAVERPLIRMARREISALTSPVSARAGRSEA